MGLIDDLEPGPAALDTPIFIYLIEEDGHYLPLIKPLFEAIDRGDLLAVTSGLSLMEVLVAPYRSGNSAIADRYESLLTHSRGLRFIEIDRRLLQGRGTAPSNIQTQASRCDPGGCRIGR